MDSKGFYGSLEAVRIPDFASEESDLSDEDDTDPLLILTDDKNIVMSEADTSDDGTNLSVPHNEEMKESKNAHTWIDGNLMKSTDETQFTGSEDLPPSIEELETPVQFFKFFFTDSLMEHITEQTNLYLEQKRPNKPVNVQKYEIEQFVGIVIYMSIVQLPSTRHYWNSNIGHPTVSSVMACNRFELIKRSLHFNNNEDRPGHDKLFKIRPFLNKIRERLFEVPKEEFLAVDEQIIPTRTQNRLKQYNPKKLHKWGYKNFVLSGLSGFSYDFDLYTGSQSNVAPSTVPNVDNVPVNLLESIPKYQNYKLFFDDWFSSIPLVIYLSKMGILPLGIVRQNHVSIISEREMKKRGVGHIVEKIANVDGVEVSVVSWFNNKIVTTISTYAGSEPKSKKRIFLKQENVHKMISYPYSKRIYDSYTRGVDSLDSMLGFYRIKVRSKKFYMRIFFHFIDLIVVNSWLLARRSKKSDMSLLDTKLSIAEALCRAGKPAKFSKAGRSEENLQHHCEAKRKKGWRRGIPQEDIRTDGIDHFPYWHDDRLRCKYTGCSGKSYIQCTKCQVPLCLNKDRNCYVRFHTD